MICTNTHVAMKVICTGTHVVMEGLYQYSGRYGDDLYWY